MTENNKNNLGYIAMSLTVTAVMVAIAADSLIESAALDTLADLESEKNIQSFHEMRKSNSSLSDSWLASQAEITRGIGSPKLVHMAYKEGIVIAPHSEPATLIVDDSHGCLMADLRQPNRGNAKIARSLLQSFADNNYKLGTYTVNGFSAGGIAANFCAKPAPILR